MRKYKPSSNPPQLPHALKEFKPKTKNQANYVRAISENQITICNGPAGSGKTVVSVAMACSYLKRQEVEKIIICRPIVESGKGLGYLPGALDEKCAPFMIPIVECMYDYMGAMETEHLMHKKIIEVVPLEYMRGRNFHNSFMILDESQNATIEQLKMFITRIGNHSKCVINGDATQIDLPLIQAGGFFSLFTKLINIEDISLIQLQHEDIIRNRLISVILERL